MKATPHAVQFELLDGDSPDRLAIGSFGDAGTGKTTFGITMPDPIGVVALDRKTRPRLAVLNRRWKKKLLFPKDDFVRLRRPLEIAYMKPDEAMKYYGEHVKRLQDAIYTLAERADVRSVLIDSGTQLYEDLMMKHFGRTFRVMPRDRGPLNADLRDIFNSLQSKNVLVTHQSKEVWRNDKPTGRFEWSGWTQLDYHCNVILEHQYHPAEGDHAARFGVTVRLCQEQPHLIGEEILADNHIRFDMLESFVYPG